MKRKTISYYLHENRLANLTLKAQENDLTLNEFIRVSVLSYIKNRENKDLKNDIVFALETVLSHLQNNTKSFTPEEWNTIYETAKKKTKDSEYSL